MKRRKVPVFIVLLMMAFLAGASAAAKPLKVEGITAGLNGDPDEYSAIINGQIVQKGDYVDDMLVTEIDSEGVRLENAERGETAYLSPGSGLGEAKPDEKTGSGEEKGWLRGFMDKHLPALGNLMDQADYAPVVRDLKKIHIEAYQYHITTMKPVSISLLVGQGRLPKFLRDGKANGYRYRVEGLSTGGVRTYADPQDNSKSLLHFMMDEHSYVYAQEGKMATPDSPRFQNGYSIEVKPDP